MGINELQNSQISLYPNPTTDKITIEISRVTEEINLNNSPPIQTIMTLSSHRQHSSLLSLALSQK